MSHDIHDRISLEIAIRIAAELPSRPEWIMLARENLQRWRANNSDSPSLLRCYDEWEVLLNQPVAKITATLTAATPDSQRLRQNSPFAGALPPRDIWDIKHRFRHEQNAA